MRQLSNFERVGFYMAHKRCDFSAGRHKNYRDAYIILPSTGGAPTRQRNRRRNAGRERQRASALAACVVPSGNLLAITHKSSHLLPLSNIILPYIILRLPASLAIQSIKTLFSFDVNYFSRCKTLNIKLGTVYLTVG